MCVRVCEHVKERVCCMSAENVISIIQHFIPKPIKTYRRESHDTRNNSTVEHRESQEIKNDAKALSASSGPRAETTKGTK